MLKKIDKRSVFKELLIYLCVVFVSVSLSNVRILYNNFVFVVPFIIFCFMNSKWYGYVAFFSSFFILGSYSKWFYLSYLLVILSVFSLKFLLKKDNNKFKNISCFSAFFLVLIEGVITSIIYNLNDYFISFILGVIGYWVMKFFNDLYISMHNKENSDFTPFLSVFIFCLLGVSLLGVYKGIGELNFSLIIIVLISFVGSRISLDIGVLYCFIMIIMFNVLNVDVDNLLFLSACLVTFLLRKTSKLTLLFTYFLVVFSYLYYKDLDYLVSVNYCLGALFFAFIPNGVFKWLAEMCCVSDIYIEKINRENKQFNLEISNKILKMEEVFSLVSSKLRIKNRLKKCEKELLIEEVNVFDDLLKSFADEIKDNLSFNYYKRVEKELYRYGYDFLYLKVKEDIFRDLVIDVNISCDKREIYKVISPLISSVMKKNMVVWSVKQNSVLGYYEIKFKEEKEFEFNYGIKQIAKDREVCGDSYLVYENDSKIIYALSDGMGVGKQAKEKSKQALELFKKFMDIGFEEERAINSINCILKSEYNKDSYATLDLFIYDKYRKEFSFCKNGACDSYIVRNREIVNVEGDKLPVGIMDKIDVSRKLVEINKGDYVVMVSDGVSEKKIEKLKNVKSNDCVKISNEVLRDDVEINDDESVIVIKIK